MEQTLVFKIYPAAQDLLTGGKWREPSPHSLRATYLCTWPWKAVGLNVFRPVDSRWSPCLQPEFVRNSDSVGSAQTVAGCVNVHVNCLIHRLILSSCCDVPALGALRTSWRSCWGLTPSVWLFQIFYPETTDIYDRKNMPRCIYCIHALRYVDCCPLTPTGSQMGRRFSITISNKYFIVFIQTTWVLWSVQVAW